MGLERDRDSGHEGKREGRATEREGRRWSTLVSYIHASRGRQVAAYTYQVRPTSAVHSGIMETSMTKSTFCSVVSDLPVQALGGSWETGRRFLVSPITNPIQTS